MNDRDNYLVHKIFVSSLSVFVAVEIANSVSRAVDGMITGHYLGSTELAAIGLSNPYFSIVGVVSGVLATGMKAVCSKSMGEGKIEIANRQFSLATAVSTIISVCLMIAGILFAEPIGMLLGATNDSAALLPYTRDYLRGLFVGAPALIGISVLSPIVQLDGDGKRVEISVIVLSICTILGDILNVTVLHGGMFGMGLTTSLAQIISVGLLALHFTHKDTLFRFSLKDIKISDLAEILRIGMPKAVKRACNIIYPIFMNYRVLLIGAGVAMSAYSIEQSVEDMTYITVAGISEVMFLISGIFYGEQDKTSIEKLFKEALKYGLIFSGIIGVIAFAGAPWVANIYAEDSFEVQRLAIIALRALAISLPIASVNESMLGYIQISCKTKVAVFFTILQKLVIPIFNCYVFSALLGVRGLYIAFIFDKVILFLCIMGMVWKQAGHFPGRIEDWLMLPKAFGIPEKDKIEISIQNMEQVINLSERVENFCKEHGVDKRRSLFLAISVEEMAGNVVKHGFSDGRKHGLNIRILIKDKDLILRMRDDCKPFNIKTWKQNMGEYDICKGIGIRLVLGIAGNVSYVDTMRMNNLLVTIPENKLEQIENV